MDTDRLARLDQLRAMGEEDLVEAGLYEEWEVLEDEWRQETLKGIPRPTCCEAAQRYPAVSFNVDVYGEDSRKVQGHWVASMHEGLSREMGARHGLEWYDQRPDAKFCPYCGTALPEMKRKDPFPERTCVVEDGGYYCATCKERLHACQCYPPEHAWEPKEN